MDGNVIEKYIIPFLNCEKYLGSIYNAYSIFKDMPVFIFTRVS